MAKKQVAEKELEAKTAELQGADARLAEKETIESEADSNLIDEIKSNTWITPEGEFDWDANDKGFGNYQCIQSPCNKTRARSLQAHVTVFTH